MAAHLPWLVNLSSLVRVEDRWLNGWVSALHSVATGSISSGWWDLITSKQQSSSSLCQMQCMPCFLVMVIQFIICPVGWGSRIHRLLLCRGVRTPPTSVLDMTLNNLMVRFQQCWSLGECGVPLHCHRSQVQSGPER